MDGLSLRLFSSDGIELSAHVCIDAEDDSLCSVPLETISEFKMEKAMFASKHLSAVLGWRDIEKFKEPISLYSMPYFR